MLARILSHEEPADLGDLADFSSSNSMLDLATDPALLAQWLLKHCQSGAGMAMRLAAQKGRGDVMLRLLDNMSATETSAEYLPTPLQTAAKHNLHAVVAHLWGRDEVRAPSQSAAANKALSLASIAGSAQSIRVLLHPPSPLDANGTDTFGNRFHLHWAAYHAQSAEAVDVLLMYGASCTSQDVNNGMVALHWSVSKRDHDAIRARIVRSLLDGPQGLSVLNAPDNDGNVALHHAARNGLTSCCEVLCGSVGVNVLAQNMWGSTPIQMAITYEHAHIAEMLERHLKEKL